MDWTVATYVAYLALSIPLTVGVGAVLGRHGRVLLEDVLGDPDLATAVDRLLAVGFHLVSLGLVCLTLRSDGVLGLEGMIEQLSTKLGVVLLVVGLLHLADLWLLTSLRRRQRRPTGPGWTAPPAAPAASYGPAFPAPGRG